MIFINKKRGSWANSPGQTTCHETTPRRRAINRYDGRVIAWAGAGFFLYYLCFLLFVSCGCTTTITPHQLTDTTASWDGTNQNSGFIGYLSDGTGMITDRARDRYNALILIYRCEKDSRGKPLFPVPPNPDDGILPMLPGYNTPAGGCWAITPEALSRFARLNRWYKQGTP